MMQIETQVLKNKAFKIQELKVYLTQKIITSLFGKGEKILHPFLHFFLKQSISKHYNFISHP
jgi:hypothetical protein